MTTTTTTTTGGEAIVESLLAHGIDTVYGLPGAQIYDLFDALARAHPRLRVIGARHEQTCGYMALGHAKSTGRPSAYAVVPGPGMLNTAAALLTAHGLNAPVLCLTGQVPSHALGRERGHLHEMRDQLGTMRQLVKWAERIEHPAQASLLVARAFQEMLSGRTGPAALEACWDVFGAVAAAAPVAPLAPWPDPAPDPDRIAAAVRLIRDARAPMIMVGGGAVAAGPQVRRLAELLGAPVASFRGGRGVLSDRHPLAVTAAAGFTLWPDTDLLIGIGSRLELQSWRWPARPGCKTVRIDIDPAEMRRRKPDVGIVARADAATAALSEALTRAGAGGPGRVEAVAAARAGAERAIRTVQPQMDYLDAIRDVLPEDGFFVDEATQVGFTSWFGFPVYQPRTFVASGYQGTLGWGLPTALGVKAANPDKCVVSVAGDGGFMFGVQDLATAVQYGLGVVTVVFDNSAYGNVRRDQQTLYQGRVVGSELVNPDFLKLADAFGLAGERVTGPAQMRPALERAFARSGPTLIVVPVERGSEASPWGFIHPKMPAGV